MCIRSRHNPKDVYQIPSHNPYIRGDEELLLLAHNAAVTSLLEVLIEAKVITDPTRITRVTLVILMALITLCMSPHDSI